MVVNRMAITADCTRTRPSRTKIREITAVAKTSKKPSTHRWTTHQRQYSAMARFSWRPGINPGE